MPVTFSDRSTKRIEFGRRGDAGDIRDDLPGEALLDSDDGREKTLQLDTSALDDETLRRVEGKAAVSRDDARGDMHGQTPLSNAERKRLDFTRTTVPEARAAKASLLAEGVQDWTAHFDPSLTTSEMADIARDSQVGGGARMDSADTQRARDRQGADMFREVQSQQAKRARDGCEDGFEEACDQLVEQHGFSRQEAESLLRQQQAAQPGTGVTADGGLRDTTVLRAAAHGRFMSEPPEPAPNAPGWRKASTGRFVGYEIDEHQGKRSPETGRIKHLDPAQSVGRDDQIDRWGDPDGGDRRPPASESDTLFGEAAFSREASAFDVSLAPAEAFEGIGNVGVTASAPGAFDDNGTIAADLERTQREDAAESAGMFDTGDSFGESDGDGGGVGIFADDRDRQASFDVGLDAGATRDREGQLAGSAGFEDRRDELGTSTAADFGDQAGLFEQETNVGGDGQTDLFGDTASETTGGGWR